MRTFLSFKAEEGSQRRTLARCTVLNKTGHWFLVGFCAWQPLQVPVFSFPRGVNRLESESRQPGPNLQPLCWLAQVTWLLYSVAFKESVAPMLTVQKPVAVVIVVVVVVTSFSAAFMNECGWWDHLLRNGESMNVWETACLKNKQTPLPHTHTHPPCLFGVYLVQGSGLNMLQEIKWQPLSLPFNKQPDSNYKHPLIEKASDRLTMIWHLSLWIWDNKGEQPAGWSKVHIDNLFANKGEKKLYCKTIQMRLPCIKPQWFKKWAIRKAILMFFLIQALRELSNHCCN